MDKKKIALYGGGGLVALYVVHKIMAGRAAAAAAAAAASAANDDASQLGASLPADTGTAVDTSGDGGDTSSDPSGTGDPSNPSSTDAGGENVLTAADLMQIYADNNTTSLALDSQNNLAAENVNDTNVLGGLGSEIGSLLPGGSISLTNNPTGGATISNNSSRPL